MQLVGWLLVPAILLLPPLCVLGVSIWARRMSRRDGMPRFVSRVAYVLVVPAALSMVFGVAYGFLVGLDAVGRVR